MRVSDLHTFFVYVFFGYIFIVPVLFFCLKLFDIKHPKQRMSLYLLALTAPIAGFVLYHTLLVKRCQTGVLADGLFWRLFDSLCSLGNTAIRYLGPLLVMMLFIGFLKALAGTAYLLRVRSQATEPAPGERARVEALLQARCQAWGMEAPVVVFSQRRGFAAFAAGFYRPVVVVSISVLAHLADQELEGILAHELVHIRRKDTVTGWLLYLLRDLMIFSPFSTMLLNRYLLERERYCDLETVEALGAPRIYAATLLKIWRLLLDEKQFSPGFAAGFTGKKGEMEQRVVSLLDGQEQRALPGVLFLTLLFSIATITVLYLGLIC